MRQRSLFRFVPLPGLRAVSFALGLGAASPALHAQSTLTVLHTPDDGTPIVSDVRTLSLDGQAQVQLEFDFGFSTDEQVAPGRFLDSFGISFGDQLFSKLVVVTTADASGTVWLPPTPGTLTLNSGALQFFSITPPGGAPHLATDTAYRVVVAVPNGLADGSGSVSVAFDLFNNGDASKSAGWFADLHIVPVPEPQLWTFGALTLLGACGWRWQRNRPRT